MAVLDGRTITDKNYVTFDPVLADSGYNTEDQVQPNGVDLRLTKVVHVGGRAELPSDGRIQAKNVQIQEIPPKNGWFDFEYLHGNYLVDFAEFISVPDGYCAIIITRSSLVRVGCDIFTGLWDTGFQGRLGGSVRLRNPVKIQYGARMCQVMFYKSVFNGLRYAGGYQGTTQSEFK